jgi:glutamyl-tRNA(Gln) amidotransferase subunit D
VDVMSEQLQGYRGEVKRILEVASVGIGDLVRITRGTETFEGTLMPRYELADDKHIVLKLPNGYNIGINIDKTMMIERLGEGSKPAFRTQVLPLEKKGLPIVAIISTGGTIASRVDYRTGAVRPALSAGDLLSVVPELSEIANIRTEILFSLLSENVHASHWTKMTQTTAKFIQEGVDGVVICHGTDTMAYTAAALSFALRNLPIPVILVGSQRSSDRPSSDATMNLSSAVKAAATLPIAGVLVGMHETTSDTAMVLHWGTKVRKCHTSRRDAFRSVNVLPVARLTSEGLKIFREQLPARDSSRKVELKPEFDEDVALLKFFPGMKPEVLQWYAKQGYKGLVLEGTGLGHVGTYLLEAVKEVADCGLLLAMTSQCVWGRVNMNVYDSGMYLQRAGVIPLDDMLPETALVKMMWCFGQTRKKDEAARLLTTNLAYEISERRLPREEPQ